MIADVLVFLKDHLNAELTAVSPTSNGKPAVDFVDGNETDPVKFKPNVVSILLINVEEDNTLRRADPYTAIGADGQPKATMREIPMNLYVLFVASFGQYETGLRQLSRIIAHFQRHRIMDRQSAPELSEEIGKLVVELVTLPFSEQNEIWNALRTTYLPSVLYKVKLIVFRHTDAPASRILEGADLELEHVG